MIAGARIVVTGAAGFIGSHVATRLLADGADVLGIDNLNAYYDPALKRARLARLAGRPGFAAEIVDITAHESVGRLFAAFRPTDVIHLAAQAGVRHSLDDPRAYTSANVDGFLSILEACRHNPVRHLVYASSSSVYGTNSKVPFAEDDPVDRPISLYAATKRANELMAGTYAHLFGIPATGVRLFTAYGPWGRPDMACWSFVRAILAGQPIELFGEGRMSRDFTYIDDIVEAIARVLVRPPAAGPDEPGHAIFNIGNHDPVRVERLVDVIAAATGREVRKLYRPAPPGDVAHTFADTRRLEAATGFLPRTSIEDGIARFVAWYRDYHRLA